MKDNIRLKNIFALIILHKELSESELHKDQKFINFIYKNYNRLSEDKEDKDLKTTLSEIDEKKYPFLSKLLKVKMEQKKTPDMTFKNIIELIEIYKKLTELNYDENEQFIDFIYQKYDEIIKNN